MQRRVRRSQPKSPPFRWLWWLAGVILISGLLLVLLAPTLVTNYLRTYIRQEGFNRTLEEKIVARFGGSARIAPLQWNDDAAGIADMSAETASGWNLEAGGLRFSLDFGAIRQGVWSIQNAGADDLALRISKRDEPWVAGASSGEDGLAQVPAFLRRHIPTKAQLSGLDVQRFFFEQAEWKIAESRLRMSQWNNSENSVALKLSGGTLQTPLNAPQQKEPLKLDLAQAALRVGTGQAQLSNATLNWKQGTEVTLRGSWKAGSGAWQTFTHVKGAPLEEFLDAAWKPRLSGKIDGDIEASGLPQAPVT